MLHRNLPNRLGWDQWALGVHLFDSLALDYKPCATIPEFFFNVGSGHQIQVLELTRQTLPCKPPPRVPSSHILCHLFSITVLHYEEYFLYLGGKTRL